MSQNTSLSVKDLTSKSSVDSSQNITRDRLKSLLPKNSSVAITDEVLDLINRMGQDVDLDQNALEEDVMSYMHLLGNSKNSLRELVNAIKFCNLKRNYNNRKAWSIVFPDKFLKLQENGGHIDNHVAMYNKGKLILAIDKEMLIPVHLQYAGYFHASVKKQFEIMNGKAGINADGETMTVSPMVRHLAAKELAVLTKPPEESKIDITIKPGEAAISVQSEMNEQLKAITAVMKQRIDAGEDIIDVQQIGVDFSEVGKPNE